MNGAVGELKRLDMAELAGKFRLTQASFADDSPELRHKYLEEVLDEALKKIPQAKRQEFLEGLISEFPSAEGADKQATEGGAPGPSTSVPRDPDTLADHLIEMMPAMSAQQKASIGGRLQKAGLLPGGLSNVETPPELRKLLGSDHVNLDVTRLVRSLECLVDFALGLDRLVWILWKEIAQAGPIRHPAGGSQNFQNWLAAYLGGSPDVSLDQLKQCVQMTRQLTSGLISAMGALGDQVYKAEFFQMISPSTVRSQAEREKTMFETIESASWRIYSGLYNELNKDVIRKELVEAIRKKTQERIFGSQSASSMEE